MNVIYHKILSNKYNNIEWFFAKLSILFIWLTSVFSIARGYYQIPIPSSICKYISCDIFLIDSFGKVSLYLISITALLYLFEIKVLYTSFIIFLFSLIFFTIEESNGILERRGLLTFVFFAQFLAYFIHRIKKESNLNKNRMQFSVQVIVAGYTLAALSKLVNSGLSWVVDGKRITLQILKSHYYEYFSQGDLNYLTKGYELVSQLQNLSWLIIVVLTFSLILELFSSVALISKRATLAYGILLLLMHIGIYWVMEIAITAILFPMLIFMINPLYLAWVFIISGSRKLFLR